MLLIDFVSSRLTVKTGNWERGCTKMSSKQKLRENMSSLFPTLEHLMLKCIKLANTRLVKSSVSPYR